MTESMDKLLSLCEAPASPPQPSSAADIASPNELGDIWSRFSCGAYGFASSLHIFGPCATTNDCSAWEWNRREEWQSVYGLTDIFFFAEDAFAEQFGVSRVDGGVLRLNPEHGEVRRVADSIDDWAQLLVQEHRNETGWPLAMEWQKRFGPLPEGFRFVARKPFVLRGEYEVENLVAVRRD